MQLLKQSLTSIVISLVLLAGVNLVWGWSAPSDSGYSIQNNVPTGNVATPLNIGNTSQYKSGALGVGGLLKAYSAFQLSGVVNCSVLGTDASGNVVCVGASCTPDCTGRACGADPVCGTSCGTCTSPNTCNASGQCVASCTDECSQGTTQCSSATLYQQCGNWDTDPCLEWGGTTGCSSGYSCSSGSCIHQWTFSNPTMACSGACSCSPLRITESDPWYFSGGFPAHSQSRDKFCQNQGYTKASAYELSSVGVAVYCWSGDCCEISTYQWQGYSSITCSD